MNKRLLSTLLAGSLVFAAAGSLQGCYGQFALTKKLYKWNGTLGDKWINSIILFALGAVQVYSLTLFIDYVGLNTAEFWSGKNPVTMAPGERESRLVSVDGKNFMVTATQNRIDLVPIEKGIQPVTVVFDPDQKAWFAISQGTRTKIAEQDGDAMALVYPDGHRERVTN